MRTRLRDNIVRPKEFTDGTVRYSENLRSFTGSVTIARPTIANTAVSELTEPSSLQEALHSLAWRSAMDDDYSALIKNDTWDLVPSRKGMNLIDSRWVFKVKNNSDGSVDRLKARLLAKGFKQR